MRFIDVFNRFEALSSDWDFLQQEVSQEEIRERIKDRIEHAGILPDVGAKTADMAKFFPTKFPISSPSVGNINVGPATAVIANDPHIAYDQDGERVEIPEGDAVTFKADTPIITTTGVNGSPRTPFSTGRLTIPVPNIPGGANEERFIFVAYLQVVRTESLISLNPSPPPLFLPPDHENIPPMAYASATSARKPITGIDENLGTVYTHHLINGYRIYIALPGEVDTTGDFPIISSLDASNEHNPDNGATFLNFASAIYIGKFTVQGGGSGNVSLIEPSGALTDTPRPFLTLRALEGTEIPAQADVQDLTDPANPVALATYAEGDVRTSREHIQARGTGSVSAFNPHAQSVSDLTQGQATPDNIEYQKESMGNGLIDSTTFENSIVGSTALSMTIVTSVTVLTGTVDPIIRRDGAVSTGQFTGQADNYLNVIQPISGQALYIDGLRVETVIPVLNDADPLSGTNGFIPFADGSGNPNDTEGDYVIFVRASESGTITESPVNIPAGVGVLGKVKLGVGQRAENVLLSNEIEIAQVYWNTTASPSRIQKSKYDSSAVVVDLRSEGLVQKPQISTKGFADARNGIAAKSVYENVVANGGFSMSITLGSDPTGLAPESWVFTGSIGTIAGLIIANTDQAEIGPRSQFICQIDCTLPVGVNFNGKAVSPAPELRPNTVYTISGWVKVITPSTNRISISARFATKAGVDLNVGSYKSFELLRGVSDWQRVAVVVKTSSLPDMSIVDPASAAVSAVDLKFENLDTDNTPADPSTFYVSDVVALEGDWVTGFVGPKVHSGEIFMWDATDTCPPGSVEVSGLQGRVPVGSFTGMAVGVTGNSQQSSFSIPLVGSTDSTIPSMSGVVLIPAEGTSNHRHIVHTPKIFDVESGGSGRGMHLAGTADGVELQWTGFNGAVLDGAHAHIGAVIISGGGHVHALTAVTVDLGEYAVLFCRRL